MSCGCPNGSPPWRGDMTSPTRDLERAVADARPILRAIRNDRVPPATDDKVLTAWNALAIRSLCVAGLAFDERRWLEAAAECASFLWANLRRGDGRLLRVWRAGVADVLAFADDHAALGLAFEALYRATGEVVWFERARWLADQLLELFADREGAGLLPEDRRRCARAADEGQGPDGRRRTERERGRGRIACTSRRAHRRTPIHLRSR